MYATWCVVWIARVPHINAMLKPWRCSNQFWSMQLLSLCNMILLRIWIATSLTCGGVLKLVKMLKLIATCRTFEMWGIVVPYLGLGYSLEMYCKIWYFWKMRHISKPIGIVPMRLITKLNLFIHEAYYHSIGLWMIVWILRLNIPRNTKDHIWNLLCAYSIPIGKLHNMFWMNKSKVYASWR